MSIKLSELSKYDDNLLLQVINSDIESELRGRGYKYGWYKEDSYIGYIYILINQAFPNLVKLGYTDNIESRLKTLNSNSGLPDPYTCYAYYKVKKRLTDLQLHDLIDILNPTLRHSKNREFYEMSADVAYSILESISKITGTEEQLVNVQNQSTQCIDSQASIYNKKAERTTFKMLQIPIGSQLVFTKDSNVIVKTVDDVNNVEYKGIRYAISALAMKLLDVKSASGYMYFKYNGELLIDIRRKLGNINY